MKKTIAGIMIIGSLLNADTMFLKLKEPGNIDKIIEKYNLNIEKKYNEKLYLVEIEGEITEEIKEKIGSEDNIEKVMENKRREIKLR